MIPNFEPYTGKSLKLRDALIRFRSGCSETVVTEKVNVWRKICGIPERPLPKNPKSRNGHLKKLIDDRIKKPAIEYYRRKMEDFKREQRTYTDNNVVMTHQIRMDMFEEATLLAIDDYFTKSTKSGGTKRAGTA